MLQSRNLLTHLGDRPLARIVLRHPSLPHLSQWKIVPPILRADAGAGLDVLDADIVVLEPVTSQQEVLLYLRATPEAGFIGDGWALRLVIFGNGSTEIDLYKAGNPVTFIQTSDTWSPGTVYHASFEIINDQVLNFYIDGALRLSYSDGGEPLGPGTVGIGGFRAGPAQIRITSFSAVEASPPVINVACTPSSVVRGGIVTCTASASDSTTPITVNEWRFDGAELTSAIIEASSSTIWTGVAATSGRVRATGTINGSAGTGHDTLSVVARSWAQDTVAYRITDVQVTGLNPRPTRVGELGNHQPLAAAFLPPGAFPQISSGPNKGVFYFTKVPVNAESEIRINRVALAFNSDFYLLQPKNVPKNSPNCSRKDVLPFLPKVEQHEGLTLADSSHAWVFRRELNRRVPQATEHVVALNDVALLLSRADTAAAPGINAAANLSKDQINGGVVPPVPYCTFKFFPPS